MDIMIVEDNPMILRSLVHTFSNSQYKVHAAIDGMQAKEVYEEIKPSIVISDVMLPYLTGLELIEYIRETEQEYTKILLLSSMSLENDIVQAFDIGADDYMTKPYISSELMMRVRRLEKYSIAKN